MFLKVQSTKGDTTPGSIVEPNSFSLTPQPKNFKKIFYTQRLLLMWRSPLCGFKRATFA